MDLLFLKLKLTVAENLRQTEIWWRSILQTLFNNDKSSTGTRVPRRRDLPVEMPCSVLLTLFLRASVFRSDIQEYISHAVFHDKRRFVFLVADEPIHNFPFNANAEIHVLPRHR